MKHKPIYDKVNFGTMLCMLFCSAAAVIRYLMLGETTTLAAVFVIHGVLCLLAVLAYKSRMPLLFGLAGAACGVLQFFTASSTTGVFYPGHGLQAALGLVGAAAGFWNGRKAGIRLWPGRGDAAGTAQERKDTARTAQERQSAVRPVKGLCAVIVVLGGGALLFWGGNCFLAKGAKAADTPQIWSVPSCFTKEIPDSDQGRVEELTYQTRAYATDEREVTKTALVYLPAGYEGEKQYNILYLLHGTGDDERAWLETHEENRLLLDNMIAAGEIEPLIVVTPTWYVEEDCREDLDQLTYSFARELREDLIPLAESTYSTYAEGVTPQALVESREHRAFAGLSRGAVTMYHSGLCASLDYFSWFGAFSGSRTDAEYFRETLQSEEFAEYPISYLYVSSGTFDFALPGQVKDYRGLLETEPRFTEGENTVFDVYPVRYHSWGSWNLALYNFLQHLF